MLRRLRDAWNKYLSSIPGTEVVDSVPEDQWDRADLVPKVSKARRSSFIEVLQIGFSHLPEVQAKALALERAALFDRADEADLALERALAEFESPEARARASAAIVCDWKAGDELEWQAALLARAHGLTEPWASPRQGLEPDLGNLASWLHAQGLLLADFSSGDNVIAFAVRPQQAARLRALLRKLGVDVRIRGEA